MHILHELPVDRMISRHDRRKNAPINRAQMWAERNRSLMAHGAETGFLRAVARRFAGQTDSGKRPLQSVRQTSDYRMIFGLTCEAQVLEVVVTHSCAQTHLLA